MLMQGHGHAGVPTLDMHICLPQSAHAAGDLPRKKTNGIKKVFMDFLRLILLISILLKASGGENASYKLLKKKTRRAITNLENNMGDPGVGVHTGVPRSKKIKAYRSSDHGIGYWALAPFKGGNFVQNTIQ